MGGFTFNGCGTGDSFYPKLSLGNHFCKYCNSIQEFDLMEVRRKIKVFYVPTFSISTKYAVACKKCKNGYYIDDKTRDDLLYGRLTIEVDSGQIIYKKVSRTTSEIAENVTNAIPEGNHPKFCKHCGARLADGQFFCASCGFKIE